MKTTDSVIREKQEVMFITNNIFDAIEWEKHYTVEERQKFNDVVDDFLSHSLAEARREERTKILDGIDRWIGDSGYPLHDCEYGKCHSNTKELIKHLRSDLLTGDNPERKV